VAGFFILAFAVIHAPLFGFKNRRLYAVLVLGLVVMAAGPLLRAAASGPQSYRAVLFGDSNTSCAFVYAEHGGLYIVNPGVDGKKLAEAVFAGGGKTAEGVLFTSLEKKNFSGLAELSRLVEIKRIIIPYGPAPAALPALLEDMKKGGTIIEKVWPGEAASGMKITARWGGDSSGYTGRGEVCDWEIGPVKIGDGGASASRLCAGPDCVPRDSIRSQKSKTTVLAFELP
jgi:hypothetical protein